MREESGGKGPGRVDPAVRAGASERGEGGVRPWGAGVGASLSLTLPRLPQSAERVLAPHEGGEEEPSGVRARQGSKALRVVPADTLLPRGHFLGAARGALGNK